jgi:hypothetical protein
MTKEDREAIAALAARFFEKSDDLIAVSGNIEELILRRQALRNEREAEEREDQFREGERRGFPSIGGVWGQK